MATPEEEYIVKAKKQIAVWEEKKPGFVANVGNAILWPVEKGLGKLVPKGVQDKVSEAIEKLLLGLDFVISKIVVRDKIVSEYNNRSRGRITNGGKLKISDDMAKEAWRWHVTYAVVQGGALGMGGFALLPADIPALFGIAIRAIKEISFCYGYGEDSEGERDYLLKVMQTGSAGDVKAKIEFMLGLKQTEQILIQVAWKKMTAELAAKKINQLAALAAIRQFAKSLGIQITKRKAMQMIPVVGALVGASFNGLFVNDICEAAYMSYRRRFISQYEKKIDKIN